MKGTLVYIQKTASYHLWELTSLGRGSLFPWVSLSEYQKYFPVLLHPLPCLFPTWSWAQGSLKTLGHQIFFGGNLFFFLIYVYLEDNHFTMLCLFLPYISMNQPSVQFSRSVVSDSLRTHGPQRARPPCPSPTPRVH